MGTARLVPALLLLLGPGLAAQPAAGVLLVAARGLSDPNFQRSVVLLVEQGEQGAWGLVVNRPTAVPLARLFAAEPGLRRREGVLFAGGPVETSRFLVLLRARRPPAACRPVFADVCLGLEPGVLRGLRGIEELRVYAGYAGWAPGQLEAEIARGDWRLLPPEPSLVFPPRPERLWEELAPRLETPVAAGEDVKEDAL
jgi:putative transcriptional regulator